MKEEIVQCLRNLESEANIRVLYACESGSRAWGFASRDSDWDVRFFFVRPQSEYLCVLQPPEHLHRDLPGEIDLTGWDLRKALHHAAKSNASVHEWLHSPMVYLDAGGFREMLSPLAGAAFRVKPVVHHYLGLATRLFAQAGEGESLNGKKCLYVLRAALCARWALTWGMAPPVLFAELLPLVPDAALKAEILDFVRQKEAGLESDSFPVSGPLLEWLHELRASCAAASDALEAPPVAYGPLDAFFQERLAVWP